MARQWYHAMVDSLRAQDRFDKVTALLAEVRSINRDLDPGCPLAERVKQLEERILKYQGSLLETAVQAQREERILSHGIERP